jgi:hypothetical protein
VALAAAIETTRLGAKSMVDQAGTPEQIEAILATLTWPPLGAAA